MVDKTFDYGGKKYPTMDLESAANERDRRVAAGEENVCIISCPAYGGGRDEDYIVVVAQKK